MVRAWAGSSSLIQVRSTDANRTASPCALIMPPGPLAYRFREPGNGSIETAALSGESPARLRIGSPPFRFYNRPTVKRSGIAILALIVAAGAMAAEPRSEPRAELPPLSPPDIEEASAAARRAAAVLGRKSEPALEKSFDAVDGEGWAVRLQGLDEALLVSRRQLAAVREAIATGA